MRRKRVKFKNFFYEFFDFGLKMVLLHIGAMLHKDYAKYRDYRMKVIDGKNSDELKFAISHFYKRATGRKLDFEKPMTFNDKLQWIKVYDSTPLKTKCADKFLVREFVKEKVGDKYLVPILGVWDSFDEIDFDSLPEKFVLKTNHASGTNVIVKNKSIIDFEEIGRQFTNWLSYNVQAYDFFELHYRDIPKKIIAEKYIEQIDGELFDYKFMCSYGEIMFVWVDSDRFVSHKRNIFDVDWNELDVCVEYPKANREIPKPINFETMKRLARKLSYDFSICRVDLYDLDNNKDMLNDNYDTVEWGGVYFGELTFCSGTGIEKIIPEYWDMDISKKINLPHKFVLKAKKQ